ncbi:MAG TPA: nitric-oxide reductase large subunit, partial [Thermoanaerobaculia bacterium]|nr:nitric-oxide reductase large subunit [Thermoanaerobaculia bacterium]
MSIRRLWIAFAAVILVSFAVLGWVGVRIYQMAPPVPDRVVSTDGRVLLGPGEVRTGQNVWQSLGGMESGSIWGHGSYVAPDWTADWLHREAVFILEDWARAEAGAPYERIPAERQAALRERLERMMRANTYDPATGTITVAPVRARAFEANLAHYTDVFSKGREDYALPAGTLTDPVKLRQLSGFFFWSSWAAATNRPGDTITYTSNWPHEELVGNRPTGDAVVWTGVSIILLLAGIGAMAFWYAKQEPEVLAELPERDPLLGSRPTPSQKATVKYFWIVSALILVQILLGVVTAHYGVEGDGFYGVPLSETLPYTITRTWHVQLGIFWIATAWLAAGLYISPAVGGGEPRGQRLGVNVLFGALLVVVVGSMVGQWMSVKQMLSGDAWFYLGHSGYEYIDLGRLWQIGLLVGLFLWFFLVWRAIRPALKKKDEQRPVLTLFLISSAAIASFYGAALGAGRGTNLAVAEYWRWWVVHLWVEGFFEVFATAVIAFLFTKLGLVRVKLATIAVLFATVVFLTGGVLGTFHHLYWAGTPTGVLALGASFSALEVVPLVLIGFEGYENYRHSKAKPWVAAYKWPILFFVSVAFWNLVGAGLFGFLINPPLALYYMQGLNTTPLHGHTALFGVYGMLGIGLMLFCLRGLGRKAYWDEKLLGGAFWTLNIGLAAMALLSLAPVGFLQVQAAITNGFWYARSAEFLQQPLMQTLVWMRMPGDVIFSVGVGLLAIFVFRRFVGKQ